MKKEIIVECCYSSEYRCSDSGRVINKHGRPLIGTISNGYNRHVLRINKKSKSVSTAATIWQSFNGMLPDGYEVDHIDGDRQNNKLSNLRAVSHKENMSNPVTRARMSKPKRRYAITYEKLK